MTHVAYIALGSNLGDRAAMLSGAVAQLALHPAIEVTRIATPIETTPVDCPPGSGAFLNGAAEVRTSLAPLALLDALQGIERALGRERSVPNAARTIDLDLLLYDELTLDAPRLTLPHPRLHERQFVLEPLAEIAPARVHPRLGRTMRELLAALPDGS